MSTEIKELFSNITNEMEGRCLSDTCTVGDHVYELRLLNGEEANWRNSNIIMGNQLSILSSIKLPTLAIGVRKIDGLDIEDAFADDWNELTPKERVKLRNENKYARKYFIAEHIMEFMAKWPDYILDELWTKWGELEVRRSEAQEELKKSLRGDSESDEKTTMTESSPIGNQPSQE